MKTVIEMAHEAGLGDTGLKTSFIFFQPGAEGLERFAALVAAAEQKKWQDQTAVEIHEAILDEREACAEIAETAADCLQNSTFEGIANAIRARAKT